MLLHGQAARGIGLQPDPGEPPRYFLPEGKMLKPFTLGHATTVSDLYWLQEIQYVGTPAAKSAGWPQLHALGDLVTDLDPEHGYAYEVTGILLTSVRRYDESNAILEKGRLAVPERWQLPFFEAFNEFYELHHYARAADLLSATAKLHGAPAYVSRLASKLYSAAGRVDAAASFVDSMLQSPNLPDDARKDLEEQRFALRLEAELQLLDGALKEYERRMGHKAASIDDLVGTVLNKLPVPPGASEWIYDPASGEVKSSVQDSRLRYKPFDEGDGLPAAATNTP